VIGFVNFDLTPAQRLPLQVAGPACLAATFVVVVLGLIFSRLWSDEMRRQRREMTLKARTQLQSLASDLIVKRGSSSGRSGRRQTLTAAAALQDPQLRRQLLLKLRQHDANGSVTAGRTKSGYFQCGPQELAGLHAGPTVADTMYTVGLCSCH